MNESNLSDIKNRLHLQRCSCHLLATTVQRLAEIKEDVGPEEARLYYGLSSVLVDIGANLEGIIIDLE